MNRAGFNSYNFIPITIMKLYTVMIKRIIILQTNF